MILCSVKDCKNPPIAKGYCRKHYSQVYVYGKIIERTKFEFNEITIEGDVCKIQIYDQKRNPKCQCLVDRNDYNKIKELRWRATQIGEVRNNKVGALSRFIMNVSDPNLEVDHKNHNRLDNRKENLRVCTHSKNMKNQKVRRDNTSGYKGVYWSKRYQKWIAQIRTNGRNKQLGLFNTKEEAALAYNKAAPFYHGEFANLNVLTGEQHGIQ